VMKALKTIQKEGSADEIEPLMDVFVKVSDGPVKTELEKMLTSMKVKGGDTAFLNLLEAERFQAHQAFILSNIWNLGYQPVEHLDIIVKVGLKGDYMTAFEVLTIIDNLEPPFDMDAIAVASLEVDDYLEESRGHERDAVIEQIKVLLDKYKVIVGQS